MMENFYETTYETKKTFNEHKYQIIEASNVADPSSKYTFTKQLRGTAVKNSMSLRELVAQVEENVALEPWEGKPYGKNCHHRARKILVHLKEKLAEASVVPDEGTTPDKGHNAPASNQELLFGQDSNRC
ncbi:hypothetical protein N0V90_006887 [Kalmusia sp. IMI 367209]|nr:hypothetical protein N0V90_006887 [Kalmusia sp. IMI 367209]